MAASDDGKHATATRVRVVACQGAIQLASAVAAMRTINGLSENEDEIENHLIIHDLSAPDDQVGEFFECLRLLANRVCSWKSIRYLGLDEVNLLQAALKRKTRAERSQLSNVLGIERCDELYVGQNSKWVPSWLRQATPTARHICFGDGIGLNFSNRYYRPKEYWQAAAEESLKHRFKRKFQASIDRIRGKFKESQVQTRPFDQYCLLLQNLFDEHIRDVQLIAPELFVELFELFAKDFAVCAPETHAALESLQGASGVNAVLLTSNFSETGRMTLEGELEGYRRLLGKLPCGPGVTLIIKPHPRDSHEKLRRLQSSVASSYAHTIALTDRYTFYLPFEALYIKYLSPLVDPHRATHVATVSSACIALEYLFGQRCELGFGKDYVEQEFTEDWWQLRDVHESDLHRILHKIRRNRPQLARLRASA